jgi:hypothetical protein
MSLIHEEIRRAVSGRHPLLYILTPEEDRVVTALESMARDLGPEARVSTWTCVDGLSPGRGSGEDTRDARAAVDAIVREGHPGFYVLKDLSEHMARPDVIRSLRNAYHALARGRRTCIAIVAPVLNIPEALQKEICLVEVQLPPPAELLERVGQVQAEYPGASIPEEIRSAVALALRGLTLNEAGHVMHRVFSRAGFTARDIFSEIFAEKELMLRKSGCIEYIPNRIDVENIGGLEILKDWVRKRRDLFTQKAVDEGLPIPKGVLIMGISGCGKSMCAKAIASIWNIPLFRLDMNLVFSGLYGSPEAAFHRALKATEAVAPAVLWIDEIENALGMTSEIATVEQSLTFSSFLTWMQERPPLVFVAATANRIESLPAEVIRKGRFDELFFCDLPTDAERREIVRIHLRMNGVDPAGIDVERLLHATRGWTGAEIEQAIVAARIDAHHEGRTMNLEHIRRQTVRMVPLSTTMAEQIKAIRSWSYQRALKASKEEPRTMLPGS